MQDALQDQGDEGEEGEHQATAAYNQLQHAPDVTPDLCPPPDRWAAAAAAALGGRSANRSSMAAGAAALMAWPSSRTWRQGGGTRLSSTSGGAALPRTSFCRNASSGRQRRGFGFASLDGAHQPAPFAQQQADQQKAPAAHKQQSQSHYTGEDCSLSQPAARVSTAAHALLSFVAGALQRLYLFHPLLQRPVCLALLSGLAAMLDSSAGLLQTGEQLSGESEGDEWVQPAPEALLLAAAQAQCVRWQLSAMGPLLQKLQDSQAAADVTGQIAAVHTELLARAASVAQSLQAEVVRLHTRLIDTVVGGALDATNWAAPRPPIKGAGRSGAAARMWRVQLAGLLHSAQQALAPAAAAEVVGEVLRRSLEATLSPRYLAAAPSPAQLPGFCADVAAVCTAAWDLCRPWDLAAEDGGGRRAADAAEGQSGGQQQAQAGQQAVALPEVLVQKVSGLCRGLCMHAADRADHPGAAAVGSPPTPAPGGAAPWSWLFPGLRITLQGRAPLVDAPPLRWPFDPSGPAAAGGGDGGAAPALWLESARLQRQ
jgi:hypothetical protein